MNKFITLGWLRARQAEMERKANDANARVEKSAAACLEVAKAPGLTPEFRVKKLGELRKPVVDFVAATIRDAEPVVALVVAQKVYWQNIEFQLARQTFDPDPAIDAAIKLQKQQEFSAMSASLLQLVADAALMEQDWPTLWVAVNVSRQHHGSPGWRGIDLTKVVLPEMKLALEAITACENLRTLLEKAWVLARGQVETPASKLTSARAAAAIAQSSRTTRAAA